jgi:hypothetical protein
MKAGSFLGLNSKEGIETCDGESFRFHIPWKGTLRMALKLVRIPPEWTTGFTGNSKILWEIFQDYQKCEGKTEAGDKIGACDAPAAQHRFDILSKIIPAAIIIYHQDSAYREVIDRMLYLIIQNQYRFKIPPHHLDPDAWYKDGTADKPAGRLTYGMVIPECQIVSADENAIVVREILQPKKYFASIEGIDHWVSLNTNYPQWVGNGWAYKVFCVYGPQSELERKTLLGD